MFWIASGSLFIIFFSTRAYLNNAKRWRLRQFPQNFSKVYYLTLQTANILLIFAGVMFLMLAIVCHVKGFEIIFSSDLLYHLHIAVK